MENTTKTLGTLLKVVSKIVTAYADKKITTGEAIAIAITAMGLVGIYKKIGAIEEEIKAFNAKRDIPELLAEFNKDFVIPDKDLEEKIKKNVAIVAEVIISTFEGTN